MEHNAALLACQMFVEDIYPALVSQSDSLICPHCKPIIWINILMRFSVP